jgi:outer membrane receptor protein involved in Fe transport
MISKRTRLLGSTIIVSAAAVMLGTNAQAQTVATNAQADQAPGTVSEVTVTGTRIRQPNLTSPTPLTVVGDQEIQLSGAQNIENLLNQLPSVTPGQTSSVSNGASGTATVDLRDLGAARTLVLVDGKRLMPGDPFTPVADLNNIPSAMVERVEVVTGGASAVYGADAVAGVVNFILKKDFQGAEIDGQIGLDQHDNDNPVRSLQGVHGVSDFIRAPTEYNQFLSSDVTAIIGLNAPDDKGNITAYLNHRSLESVTQDHYDVSSCSISNASGGYADSYIYGKHVCAGSNANSAYGRFNSNDGPTLHVNPDGSHSFVTTSVPAFNYAPFNYFQRPEDRYTAGFEAHYKVNEHFEPYADLMFADDHTVAQIAPSGLFYGTGPNLTSGYQINCDNPLMTATQQAQFCGPHAGTPYLETALIGFRFAGYNRQDDIRHTNYKLDIGAKGEIGQGWTYDAYLQYGTSIYNEHYNNDTSTIKIQNALIVDPATGQCVTGGAACVPLNIFQYGQLTPAMLNYVITPGFKTGQTEEQIASASVNGDLGQYGVKSPWASEGMAVAFGTEYRHEELDVKVDQEFLSGDLSGQGGPTLPNAGAFDVYELFGEARLPLVTDKPFVRALNLDVGYRFSDYSTSGKTDTYKAEVDWAINRDVRLRGGYNRAVRAPNVDELFSPSSVGLFGGSDPCTGVANAANYSAACVATFTSVANSLHITPAQAAAMFTNIPGCAAGQCSQYTGGNAALKPEVADTFTGGVVFTPTWHWLHGFTASVDYYYITVNDVIQSEGAPIIISKCVEGDLTACQSFHRDPTSGILFGNNGYVINPLTNEGFNRTNGVDVAASYRFNPRDWGLPNFGTLGISMLGTYVNELKIQPVAGGATYNCAGLYGVTCGEPLPHWKSRVRFTYTAPSVPVTVSLDWRYIGAVKLDANEGTLGETSGITGLTVGQPGGPAPTGNSLLAFHPYGLTDAIDETIKAYSYFDLSVTWRVRGNLNLRAGVANILDKDPPVLGANLFPVSANGNTYPGTYDSLGRTIFVGLTANF